VLEFLRTTRGRIVAALLASLVVVALAVLLKYPFAILPALLAAVWVPVYVQREPVSPPARRLMLVLAGGLAALAGLGVFVFILVER
jgi:hypothetical protein